MHMSQISLAVDARPEPIRIIRTGLADGCLAHFHPELYQLVLQRDGFDEKVELGFSGSRLLERLLREPGEVVPRDELLAHAWSDRVVGQGSLNQQIYTLRQILGDEKRREIIQTLPRRGYMLNPKFAVCARALAAQAAQADPAAASDALPAAAPTTSRYRLRALDLLAICTPLLLLAVGLAGIAHFLLPQAQQASEESSIGNKRFLYINGSEQGLRQLRERTQALSTRLAALSPQPLRFVLARQAGFYELTCTAEDDSTRLLLVHQDQLDRLSDAQLRSCLQ